jgi:hypothetical protein
MKRYGEPDMSQKNTGRGVEGQAVSAAQLVARRWLIRLISPTESPVLGMTIHHLAAILYNDRLK